LVETERELVDPETELFTKVRESREVELDESMSCEFATVRVFASMFALIFFDQKSIIKKKKKK